MSNLYQLITLVLAMLLMFGCVETPPDTDDNVIDEVTLSAGEKKSYSINSESPVTIGILCVNEPNGGLVQMKEIGSVSQISTYYFASREWVFAENEFRFEVINNATNDVTIRVYFGDSPPENETESCRFNSEAKANGRLCD